jgi:hypothetical protein
MDEHHPLRNAQTSTVTPVPGRRVMHNICFGYTTANLQFQALHSGTPTLLPAAPNNTANTVPRPLLIACLSPAHLLRNSTAARVVQARESPRGDGGAR